jgi:HprK-related kinase B
MPTPLLALAERLAADHPTPERLSLAFAGHRIDVVSNSHGLVETLRDYFSGFDEGHHDRPAELEIRAVQAPPPDWGLDYAEWRREPGKRTRKEAFVDLADGRAVLKVRTGVQFLLTGDLRIAVGDCLSNHNQIVNFVNFQFTSFLMNQGLALCHAAGVADRGLGLALAGFSGGGKSTLALHLMSSGLDFTSNDRLLVGQVEGVPERQMFGIPKHPRINPGTALANPDLAPVLSPERRRELEKLSRDELWPLEEKYDAPIDQLYGPERFCMRAPVVGLVILAWSHRSAEPARFAEARLAERPDLLDAVMKSPGPFFQPESGPAPTGYEPPDPGPYLESLGDLPVYEATGGVDFEAGVRFCRDLLREAH